MGSKQLYHRSHIKKGAEAPGRSLGVADASVGEARVAVRLVWGLVGRCIDTTIGGVAQVSQRGFSEALLAADGLLDEREVRHRILHSAQVPVAWPGSICSPCGPNAYPYTTILVAVVTE